MNNCNYKLVICNVPDMTIAKLIATTIVENKLAACVNILPQVQSLYMWDGKLEESNEITLLIKTTASCYNALENKIKELHPYELPEIIAINIDNGLPEYLQWLSSQCQN